MNFISNIGCTESSAHVDDLLQLPKGIRRVFYMKTYEIDFPLKHARYVIPDVGYEKKRNRIMGYNTPVIAVFRKLERVWIKIKKGDFKYIVSKIISKRTIER